MKKLPLRIIHLAMVVGLFSACSGGNKFASSFGKRKYIKGYYMDMPSSAPKVAEEVCEAKRIKEQVVISTAVNSVQKGATDNEAKILFNARLKLRDKPIKAALSLIKQAISVEKIPITIHSNLPIQYDDGKHSSDTDKKWGSGFSKTALVCFLVGIGLILIGLLLALVLAPSLGWAALGVAIVAFIIALILDIVAMILAFIGILINEDRKDLGEVVLFANAIILAIILIIYAAAGH